jgi:amino acid adenylation domain-containing protein
MEKKNQSDNLSFLLSHFTKEENYWVNKLSGEWEKTRFPVSYRNNKGHWDDMKWEIFQFTGELFEKLVKLSNSSDIRLFMIMVAGLSVLLFKYTDNKNIVLGSPTLKQEMEAEFINTLLPLRNQIKGNMTFKELLMQVKQTVIEAMEHQNYPVKHLPDRLNITFSEGDEFPLFDIAVLVENIHDKTYIQHIRWNTIFSFFRTCQYIQGKVGYNPALYEKKDIKRIIDHFIHLFEEVFSNIDIQVSDISILREKEKKQLLFDFNNTEMAYPGYENSTIHQLFEEQVKRTPGQKAVSYTIDLSDIYKDLEVEGVRDHLLVKYEGCYFKKNPYVFKFTNNSFLSSLNISDEKNPDEIMLLYTHKHDYIAVNQSTFALVDCFSGRRSLKAILTAVSKKDFEFLLFPLSLSDIEGSSSKGKGVRGIRQLPDLVVLIKILYRYHLIKLVDFEANPVDGSSASDEIEKELSKRERSQYAGGGGEVSPENKRVRTVETFPGQVKSPVLLLGDTTGTATVGLLYIASYLRRHSIEAYCQWNDFNRTPVLLKRNVENLLLKIRPKVVGISMKWFQHIARVLEICRIVKVFDSSIEIALGGNTASYYQENFIRHEFVDYIILGDGEVPLLKICKNEKVIPNCVYREAGQIIHTGITYVQDEKNSSDIYLSHLDEIFVSKSDPFLASSFMVYTGKGCAMSCFYCGGCLEAQKKVFNRQRPFLRRIKEIRKDLQAVKKYASTLMFDFDLPDYAILDYYKKIFAGIDLSNHFCEIYFWKIPSPELIDFISRTFKYAYLSIDVASLSERHRKQLTQLGVVKPQATDEELFCFFQQCKQYENVEVSISQIAGLPYFNDKDIVESHRVLSKIIGKYGFFTRIDWGRLHAQPGAPLTVNSQSHGMKSYARTYDDFLKYSELNFKEEIYPGLATNHYPYIYSQDDNLNSKISKYFGDTEEKINENKEKKKQRFIISKSLTYAKLNEEADRLAGLLKQEGVGPEIITGLMVRRSLEMIVGIMAILKAGGPYLPIDPEYPQSRIKYMLEDSGVDILLISTLTGGINANVNGMVSTVIDMSDPTIYGGTGSIPHLAAARSGDSAYVIYTSGTTGRPKGVVVEHRSAVNTLMCRKTEYHLNSQTVSLQLFSCAFDGFVTSFFTPIISGAEVILPGDDAIKNLSQIKEIIPAHRVTHFISVPSLFQAILEELGKEEMASLKIVTLAGEKLLPTTVDLAKQKHPTLEITQEYGVTEVAVMSTLYRNQQQDKQMKIGKPTWNTRIYILGKENQLQPIGVPGELCIAGTGIARGYLNRPQLIAEKFKRVVTGHWSFVISSSEKLHKPTQDLCPITNDRLYQTGDLARWLEQGNIEFLGRLDQQVKIRGNRIELGEVENCLLKHEQIKDTVVLVKTRENNPEDKFLCAYLVPLDPALSIPASQLREYLAEQLPDYMLPSYFVTLEKIPLNPNGKIQQKALPEPEYTHSEAAYVPPKNQIQKKLSELWAGILKVEAENIGIDTNFFEIGGHSLNATIMTSQVHQVFNVNIPLVEIFKFPTIRGLSGYISRAKPGHYTMIPLAEKKEYYPLSSAQKRIFFLHQWDNMGYNISQVVNLEGKLRQAKLEKVFQFLIGRHESFRTAFLVEDGEPIQKIQPAKDVPFNVYFYEAWGEEVKEIIAGFITPFDLSEPPLLKVGIIKATADRHILMVSMHHLVADGFSFGTLTREFMQLYGDQPLSPMKLQYKDFSQWQSARKTKELMKKQEAYWLEEFADHVPRLKLPTDFPRPDRQSFEGSSTGLTIAAAETNALKTMAQEEDVTLFMLILAIWVVLLSGLTGQEDIAVGTPIAGRRHAQLQETIGIFINTLVLRNYPTKEKTFKQFLQEVKQKTIAALDNQDYQFEDLVNKLVKTRDVSRNPLFDVMFTLENLDIPKIEIPGLKLKPYDYKNPGKSWMDIVLQGYDNGTSISFTCYYDSKLFKKETIDRFMKYFREIITTVSRDKETWLKDIPITHDLVEVPSHIPQVEFEL